MENEKLYMEYWGSSDIGVNKYAKPGGEYFFPRPPQPRHELEVFTEDGSQSIHVEIDAMTGTVKVDADALLELLRMAGYNGRVEERVTV